MFLKNSKISICCLFTVFSLTLFAQERPRTDTNFVDKKGRKQGVWKKIDSTGLSYIGQFKDNKPYGRFTYFNKYGQTMTVSDFFRDGFATQTTHFYTNGNLKASGFYLDKLRDSVWKFYDTTGRILKTEHYLNGMLHGLTALFDQNENLIETQEWYRGLRNGLWWQKSENGTQTVNYKLNKSHGAYTALYPDKKPYIKGIYEDGLKEKTWYFYHDDGTLDRVIEYKNNRLVKKQIALRINGKDILIDTDSVAYVHTNGKITQVQMLNGTTYKPSQHFDKLVKSFESNYFFLATPSFLTAFSLYDSFEILSTEMLETTEESDDSGPQIKQTARLKLKIPTPYEIIINEEVIQQLQNLSNPPKIDEL